MKMVGVEKSQEREDKNLDFSGLEGSKVDLKGALAEATDWEEQSRVYATKKRSGGGGGGGNALRAKREKAKGWATAKGKEFVGDVKNAMEKVAVKEKREEDMRRGHRAGEEVYAALAGYTTEKMQKRAISYIEDLDINTINAFFEGFHFLSERTAGWISTKGQSIGKKALYAVTVGASTVPTDGEFFKQLYTENNFPKKHKLIKHVALLFADLREKQGDTRDASIIRSFCKGSLGDKEIDYLSALEDRLYKGTEY